MQINRYLRLNIHKNGLKILGIKHFKVSEGTICYIGNFLHS
jgi:hypothetical protein